MGAFMNSGLVAVGLLLTILAVCVWRSDRSSVVHRSFAVFTTMLAMWTLALYGFHLQTIASKATFWCRLSFAVGVLIAPSLFIFVTQYGAHFKLLARVSSASLGLGLAFSLVSMLTPFIVRVAYPAGTHDTTRDPGVLYPALAVYVLLVFALAFTTLVYTWLKSRGIYRVQLSYLVAAVLIPGISGMMTNLIIPVITGRSRYGSVGPYCVLIFVGIVAHAIIRHRLMDVRWVIRSWITITASTALSLVPVTVIILLARPRLSRHFDRDELGLMFAGLMVAAFMIPLTRDAIVRVLDRYVYRTQADYRRTVLEASRILTRVLNLKRILSLVSETVVRATQTEGVSIYLKDDDRNEILRRAIALQTPPAPGFLTPDLAPATMVTALRRTNDVIVTEELSRPGCDNATRALHDDLAALNWTLVLPVLSEGTVIGAIVLGPKLSGDPFYPQDFDLLMTLANQAGIAIKNAQLYAEVVLANEYIENIIATAKSGVVAVNASGRITMFNPAAETLTGLPRAAAIGQDASAMLPAPLAAMLAISVQSGQAVTEPEIELSGGGTMRPVICTTSPLRDETAAMLGAVAVFSDLTPLKELEVERRRAERLAYLETLASALAHEIKNPLVSIKTFAQLIPRRRDDDEFIQRFSRIAAREIGQMERLLERLRTLARPSERRHHPVDLRLPLREALETMQPIYDEKSVALLVELGDDPFTVRGDHDELKQLFHNLLINAHEATPPAGTVTVRLKGSPDSGVVTVADSGAGIAPELLERVFEPFFTTKQRGTGLGLAICASIAAAHRARLRAANGPGGGAQFTIEFARTVAVPAPTPA